MYQSIVSAVTLLICTYTDIRSRKIYMSVLTGYLLLVIIGYGVSYFSDNSAPVSVVTRGLIPGAICLLISFLTRQGIGYGDSILIIICGMSLGGTEIFSMLLTAFFWSGVWGFIMWRFFRADRKKEIPFIPFLLAGFLIQKLGKLWGI